MFERFYRAEQARKLPGSGLGLAIVSQAAEAHGGYVRAENAAGGGARLVVSFGAAYASVVTSAGAVPASSDELSAVSAARSDPRKGVSRM